LKFVPHRKNRGHGRNYQYLGVEVESALSYHAERIARLDQRGECSPEGNSARPAVSDPGQGVGPDPPVRSGRCTQLSQNLNSFGAESLILANSGRHWQRVLPPTRRPTKWLANREPTRRNLRHPTVWWRSCHGSISFCRGVDRDRDGRGLTSGRPSFPVAIVSITFRMDGNFTADALGRLVMMYPVLAKDSFSDQLDTVTAP